ncbi:MAG: AmmeMemoRadiSam system protein B [Nanoarchaeota archaeon]|nr:AmmeMemoRadiSam system protein B [Nanoarchaeota archaeon]
MTRTPIVSGTFYPSNFGELDKLIKESFEGKLGPGSSPSNKKNKNIKGVIVPHAGYQFSGQCAAWAFKEIAESTFPQTYIIIGNNHSEINEDSVSTEDWQTPLGIIKNDIIISKALIDNENLYENNEAHYKEHSIEVQLPFLQISNKANLNELKIVPIMIATSNYKKIADRIHKVIKETGKKVCIICSSDFTHHGPNYSYIPFKENIKENLYKQDQVAINFIQKLDNERFLNYVKEKNATICGSHNIAVMIELCKKLGSKKARLLRYYTSGDILNDYTNAVGYASIIFD